MCPSDPGPVCAEPDFGDFGRDFLYRGYRADPAGGEDRGGIQPENRGEEPGIGSCTMDFPAQKVIFLTIFAFNPIKLPDTT